jgi:signal transduction histidine kinase
MDEIWSLLARILSEQESSVDWVLCRLCSLWQAALGDYDVCAVSCREKAAEGRFLVCAGGEDPASSNIREFDKLASTDWTESVSTQLHGGFDEFQSLKFRSNDRMAVGGILIATETAIADDDLVETLRLVSGLALRAAQRSTDPEPPTTGGKKKAKAAVVATPAESTVRRDKSNKTDWQAVALDRDRLESMAEFAAGAGHEINNPLGTIVGRVQLLLKEETDIDRRQSLSTIGGQAYRIRDMIGDAMLFARPPKPDPDWNSLGEVIEEVLGGFEEELAAGEFNVDVEFPRATRVFADAVQLRVVLGALVRNAIEAAEDNADHEIQIRAEQGKTGSIISVADNGVGLDKEQRRHLFDPFYSGRQAGRGLGFGLSKTWRIVSNHSGTIEVDTERGWTTFQLTFPDSPD